MKKGKGSMADKEWKCTGCEGAFSYFPGLKGEHADDHKILMILNHSDSRMLMGKYKHSYSVALPYSNTGRVLEDMLEACDLSLDDVYLTNVFKCLLPHDREPRKGEYVKCRSVLERQIDEYCPERIISFGQKAYENLFPEVSKDEYFADAVDRVIERDGVPSLVCYHPRKIYSFPKEDRRRLYKRIARFLL
jgi:uracil-DNA glycosylase family 4